jgi:hypothetical protein
MRGGILIKNESNLLVDKGNQTPRQSERKHNAEFLIGRERIVARDSQDNLRILNLLYKSSVLSQ